MKTFHSIDSYIADKPSVITIGTFDGVHIGHQKIIQQVLNASKSNKLNSVVLTFFPHPRMVLQKDFNIKLINTIEERTLLLKESGIHTLIIHPFNKTFSKLTALEFVRDILVKKLHVSKLVIGYDHHFGKNREGNVDQLQEYAHTYDFEIIEIPAQDIDAIAVSSTKIRAALKNGAVKKAGNYLSHLFTLSGLIVKGNSIGKKIGFPTANIQIKERYKIIPKKGAYIVKSIIDNKNFYGMLNIGNRPTINDNKNTIEVHFLDLNQNLYDKTIKVSFLKRLRDEVKFESLDALKAQLSEDKKAVENYIKNLTPSKE